jgi:ATP-dependent Lon protease
MPGLYRLELQVTKGSGKLAFSGLWNSSAAKEQIKIAIDYFKANASRISVSTKVMDHDFHLHVVELQNSGPLNHMVLASLVAFASAMRGKPVQGQMVVLGVQTSFRRCGVQGDGRGLKLATEVRWQRDLPRTLVLVMDRVD